MKRRFSFSYLVLFCFITTLIFFTSCEKENSRNGTEDEQEVQASKVSSESDSEAELLFNGIFDDAMGVNAEVGLGGTGIFGRTESCPEITVTRLNPPAPFPVKIVMDFGVNGCVGNDGHRRRGKIITVYSNRLTIPDATAITTFEDFYIGDTKVEGTHKIANTSPSPNSTPQIRQFTTDVIEAKLTKPDGNYIQWNSHKVITQLEGLSTHEPRDDIFKIEGTSRGKVKRGDMIVLWESAITEPLFKKFTCRWIVKGKVKTIRANLSSNSRWVAELDFGTGNCDNLATITINGVLHQITLR